MSQHGDQKEEDPWSRGFELTACPDLITRHNTKNMKDCLWGLFVRGKHDTWLRLAVAANVYDLEDWNRFKGGPVPFDAARAKPVPSYMEPHQMKNRVLYCKVNGKWFFAVLGYIKKGKAGGWRFVFPNWCGDVKELQTTLCNHDSWSDFRIVSENFRGAEEGGQS